MAECVEDDVGHVGVLVFEVSWTCGVGQFFADMIATFACVVFH